MSGRAPFVIRLPRQQRKLQNVASPIPAGSVSFRSGPQREEYKTLLIVDCCEVDAAFASLSARSVHGIDRMTQLEQLRVCAGCSLIWCWGRSPNPIKSESYSDCLDLRRPFLSNHPSPTDRLYTFNRSIFVPFVWTSISH